MGILLPGDVDWSPAAWVSRGLFSDLHEVGLPVRLEAEVRFCLDAAVDTLDLRGASGNELRALRQAIARVVSRTEAAGPAAFQTPEFQPTYLEWLRKLMTLLS